MARQHITAYSLPGDDTNGREGDHHSSDSGLSLDHRKVVIATTTIGGTFILALLIYVLWRRRRGARYSEMVRFRNSDSVVINPMSDDERLTALPIYRHKRFSIRSSRHDSVADLHKQQRKLTLASSLWRQDRSESPLKPQTFKTSNPPKTPTQEGGRSFLHDATPPQKPVAEPEQAHMSSLNRMSTMSLPVMRQSPSKAAQSRLSVKELGRTRTGSDHLSQSPDSLLGEENRWSWTNSQAPPTPKMTAPTTLRSSLTSLKARSVASWAKTQGRRLDVEPSTANRSKKERSRPLLKNQALKPVLAPPSASKRLSKTNERHGRVGSLSSIFKPNPGSLIPSPLSPRLEEQRPDTEASIEMTMTKRP